MTTIHESIGPLDTVRMGEQSQTSSTALTPTDLHNIRNVLPILIRTHPQFAQKLVSTLPPHPQISQVLTAIPLGFQMAFNQLTSPTVYGNTIDSYRIYRNTNSNSFSGAVRIRTVKHDPTHQGAVTDQDTTD